MHIMACNDRLCGKAVFSNIYARIHGFYSIIRLLEVMSSCASHGLHFGHSEAEWHTAAKVVHKEEKVSDDKCAGMYAVRLIRLGFPEVPESQPAMLPPASSVSARAKLQLGIE